jgi:hypothetical protein
MAGENYFLKVRGWIGSIFQVGATEPGNQATATITVTASPITVGQGVVVNGTNLLAVAGARTPGADDFDGSLGTPAAIAADIAAAINDGANSFVGVASATVNSNVVTITADATNFPGTAGNAVTLSSTSGSITVSGATLAGGTDGGPQLKVGSNNMLDVRDGADAAYVNVRGADPIIDDDLITKRYGDATYGVAGAVRCIRFAVGTATVSSVTAIPANARVVEARFEVTTQYDVGTDIDVGDGVTADLIMDTTDIQERVIGTYTVEQDTDWTTGNVVTVTVSGAPAAGAGVCMVFYTVPQA